MAPELETGFELLSTASNDVVITVKKEDFRSVGNFK